MNIKQLFEILKEQARALIDLGDSHEKREGYGMLRVIDAMENLPDHEGGRNPKDYGIIVMDIDMDTRIIK